MRLHRLEVTAFGPFAGTETVDFDALADAGLFLFTGPTGAGKTSVLDAVCFALYGQVPGARGGGSRRCAATTPPTASRRRSCSRSRLRGRRLRLTRSPQWERPKRRGSGTLTEQSRVHLEECGGGGLDHAVHPPGRDRPPGRGPAGAQPRPVLPGGAPPPGPVRRVPAGRRREAPRPAREPVRHRPVHRRRALAGGPPAGDRSRAGRRRRAAAQVLARVVEAAGLDVPTSSRTAPRPELGGRSGSSRPGRTGDRAGGGGARRERHEAATAAVERRHARRRGARPAGGLQTRLAQLTEAAPPMHEAAAAEVAAARAVAPLVPLVTEVARLQVELEEASGGRLGDRAGARRGAAGDRHRLPPRSRRSGGPLPEPCRRSPASTAARSAGCAPWPRTRPRPTGWRPPPTPSSAGSSSSTTRRQRLAGELDTAPARRAELEAPATAARPRSPACPARAPTPRSRTARIAAAEQRDALLAPQRRGRRRPAGPHRRQPAGPRALARAAPGPARRHGGRARRRPARRRRLPGLRQHRASRDRPRPAPDAVEPSEAEDAAAAEVAGAPRRSAPPRPRRWPSWRRARRRSVGGRRRRRRCADLRAAPATPRPPSSAADRCWPPERPAMRRTRSPRSASSTRAGCASGSPSTRTPRTCGRRCADDRERLQRLRATLDRRPRRRPLDRRPGRPARPARRRPRGRWLARSAPSSSSATR